MIEWFHHLRKDSRMKKYNLLNWILGNLTCMLGVAFATKSDFGLSMIAAGPYIIHVKLRETLAWFTQGTSEYFFEAAILILLCLIIRKFKFRYLLSFAEAFLAGMVLDGWLFLMGGNGAYATLGMRIVSFVLGLVICSLGVAFFFRTEMPLQVYELAVVNISETFSLKRERVKLGFDLCMLALSLVLALTLTGKLTGIGIGTVVTTLLNSTVISFWGKLIDRIEKQ